MAICIVCGHDGPVSDFPSTRQSKSGHIPRCRPCERRRLAAWKAANPERVLASRRAGAAQKAAYDKEYYAKNRLRIAERAREYGKANREADRKRSRRYRKAHPERVAERTRRYQQENPEKVLAFVHAARARRLAAEGRYTPEDLAAIRKAQKNRCLYCRTPLKGGGEIDHIIPLVKGGTNWPKNLGLACRPCNRSKSSRDQIVFMQERGLLL